MSQRVCEEGGVCHWKLKEPLPRENGKHMLTWFCEKCLVEEVGEVLIL